MESELDVRVTGGMIRGLHAGGVRVWRGIPFAASPVDALRFRSPAPVAPWSGLRAAAQFGPVARQDRDGPFPGARPSLPQSEDCLTINVQAPIRSRAAGRPDARLSLPVMVYIHGGAYSVGAPPAVPDRGINFVRRGFVHVTFNYRLNVFGYLDFSRYGFDSNLGLRDQVAALEWVRDNIAGFGGDPARVTVYGESSGGNAVTTLLATPAARGLFARAIAQSPPSAAVYPASVTHRWAGEFMRILGVPQAGEAAALLQADAATLVTAARILFSRVPDSDPGAQAFCPVVDGDYLPRHPLDVFRDGASHPVPLIIGTNDREGSIFTGRRTILASTPSRIRGLLAHTPPDATAELTREYGYPGRGVGLELAGDFAFWYPATLVADGHSHTAPTYSYRVDFAPRLLRMLGLGATHGIDLLTVFGRTGSIAGRLLTAIGGARDFRRLSERMEAHWARFAADGTVDPVWPAYDTATRSTLVFDRDDAVEHDARQSKRIAWDGFVPVR